MYKFIVVTITPDTLVHVKHIVLADSPEQAISDIQTKTGHLAFSISNW